MYFENMRRVAGHCRNGQKGDDTTETCSAYRKIIRTSTGTGNCPHRCVKLVPTLFRIKHKRPLRIRPVRRMHPHSTPICCRAYRAATAFASFFVLLISAGV